MRGVRIRDRRPERRRLVLEHGDVVVARHLGRVGRRRGRQRVEFGRREEHAILARGGNGHPLARQRVLPHRGGHGTRLGVTQVGFAVRREGRVGVVEVDQLATIGEGVHAFGDRGHTAPFEGGFDYESKSSEIGGSAPSVFHIDKRRFLKHDDQHGHHIRRIGPRLRAAEADARTHRARRFRTCRRPR